MKRVVRNAQVWITHGSNIGSTLCLRNEHWEVICSISNLCIVQTSTTFPLPRARKFLVTTTRSDELCFEISKV